MSDERVVTELVIDADTSGADRYSQAMDRASGASQQGASSAAGMTLAVAGVGAAVIGALAGLRSFIDYVGAQSQALVDMADHAQLAGMSTKEFQQTLFAARAAGLTEKDFVSGLDKIGEDLTAAGRGVSDFGKLFEVNGLSIKNANGELKTTKQALTDLAGLMQNASPQVQQAMAKIVGVSASWIPFLRQGVDGIEAQKKAAADLGVVISDDMIAKAKDFNGQWKTAVATWDLQFKASLAGIMPLLIQMANLASTILQGIGNVTGSFSRWMTPDEDKNKSQLNDQINELQRLRDIMATFGNTNYLKDIQIANLQRLLGLPEGASLKEVDALMDKLILLYDKKPTNLVVTPPGGSTVLPPSGNNGKDQLERAIDVAQRHIAITRADTAAIGETDAALAGLRVEAELYAAAERAGFKDLEQFAEKFLTLRDDAEAAKKEFNELKLASEIKFAAATKFLDPESVQIAQQLKGLYPDVATALDSVEAAQIRVNNAQKDFSDGVKEVGRSMLSAFLSGKNVMDAMVSSLDNLAKKLSDKAFENILGSILTGDPVQAAIGIAQAGASALISAFTGDQKAKQELQKAQEAWKAMASQVTAFNQAARGFSLGPLTNELNSLYSSVETLMQAALKAKDTAGAAQLANTFNHAVERIAQTFAEGAKTLTPLQQAIKGVNDEASGLIETLSNLNYGGAATTVVNALQGRIDALIAQYRDTLVTSLSTRLNSAQGNTYLNDAAALIKQHASDLTDAATLGNDPALLAQIAATFQAEAQKIVEGAGLTGDAFTKFMGLFPDFTSVVHQATTQFAASIKSINDYLKSLEIGSKSILSPQDQLKAANDNFSSQLALAKGGDATALGSITQVATTLLDQAKSFYASGSGYADVYNAVTAALRSLGSGSGFAGGGVIPGMAGGGIVGNGLFGIDSVLARYAGGGAIGLAGGEHVTRAPSVTPQTLPVLQHINKTGSVPSNDNGAHFAALGDKLVRALTGCSLGEIGAMREDAAALRNEVRALRTAVEANKPKAVRPNDRSGAAA
jgi:hypothetical protein